MKPRYSNDKTAPRMKKGEFSKNIIDVKMWREFKKQFPEYKHYKTVELNKLWSHISEIIREEVVKNPLGVKLGSYTGELKLQYLPHKFEAIAQGASEEAGENIKPLNILTRSKVAKVKWERRWAVKFNKMLQFYAFEPNREILKEAQKYINENPEKLRVSRNTLGGQSFWRNLGK